jgi:hypothetical protein
MRWVGGKKEIIMIDLEEIFDTVEEMQTFMKSIACDFVVN